MRPQPRRPESSPGAPPASGAGDVAQLVEHRLCKAGVEGSSPFVSTAPNSGNRAGSHQCAQRCRSFLICGTIRPPSSALPGPTSGPLRVAGAQRWWLRHGRCAPHGSPKQINAATGLVSRLLARPSAMPARLDCVLSDPRTPHERIAAELHAGVVDGSALLTGSTRRGPAAHRQGASQRGDRYRAACDHLAQ